MIAASKIKLLLFILTISVAFPFVANAQFEKLPIDKQRLLLQQAFGYYNVVKQNEVDLDSSLFVAARYLKLNQASVILDGFGNDINGTDVRWLYQNNPAEAVKQLNRLTGLNHAKLSLLLGAYYAFQHGKRPYADSALNYLFKAKNEAEQLHAGGLINHTLILIGKSYFKIGDFDKGLPFFNTAIANAKKTNDWKILAKANFYLGTYSPFTRNSIMIRIGALEKASILYKQLHQYPQAAIALMYQGYMNFALNNLLASKKATLESLHIQDSIGFPYTHYNKDLLAILASQNGDNVSVLIYALASVKSAEDTKDRFGLTNFYYRVATAYNLNTTDDEKALVWDKKALDEAEEAGNPFLNYNALEGYALNLRILKRLPEAIKTIRGYLHKRPPDSPLDLKIAYQLLATCYDGLNNYRDAQKYFLKALTLEKQKSPISTISKYGSESTYMYLGAFYLKYKKYDQARYYISQYVLNPSGLVIPLSNQKDAELWLAQIDSASGNFRSAYLHHQKYQVVHDQIYNTDELKQLESQKIKYETDRKQDSIKLLEAQRLIDHGSLQTFALQRNLTLGGVAALLLISGIIYRGYRGKQRSNRALEIKQEEINAQNHTLENLLTEKITLLADQEHLLFEKDLLLKEVHHRVKNNLHLIVSLLESQSIFLEDTGALTAIKNSQNRVQAMSLIHQKLYLAGNVASINLESYLRDLVAYLNESIGKGQNLYFELTVAPIDLDVSQAVPLGLIINELITNAVKYAFPENRKGTISISVEEEEKQIILNIRDNGIGLPPNFDINKINSLGLQLIKGLCEDLGAALNVQSDNGTQVNIIFSREVMYDLEDELI